MRDMGFKVRFMHFVYIYIYKRFERNGNVDSEGRFIILR